MHIRITAAAAALLLGASYAGAQTATDLPPEPAPPAHQNAPAEVIAPPMNAGQRPAPPSTTGQAPPAELAPGTGKVGVPDDAAKQPSGKDANDMKGSSNVDGATR